VEFGGDVWLESTTYSPQGLRMCHTLIVLLGIAADWLCALAKFHGGAQYCQVAERFSNLLLTFTLALPPPSLSPSWNGPAEVVRAAQVANMGARSGQEWTSLLVEQLLRAAGSGRQGARRREGAASGRCGRKPPPVRHKPGGAGGRLRV